MPAQHTSPRTRRSVGALLALVLVALALVAFGPGSASAADTTTPVTVSATSPSTSSLKVSWTAATGAGFDGWVIHLKDTAGRTWPPTAAPKASRSTVIDGLVAGMRYEVQVVGYGTPMALGSALGTVQGASCAGVTGTCVSLGSTAKGVATNVGQGILHGTTVKSDLTKAAALEPASWRIGATDFARMERARGIGGAVTLLMSDPWRGWADRNGLAGQNPWADWDKYRTYIQAIVQWHINAGMLPEYWEVQNEPDYADQYTATPPATRALILEQFKVAHDAIRALLPDARIVGPSLAQYRLSSPQAPVDLRSFLDYMVANDLQFDLSWHEIGNSVPNSINGDPRSIVSHVQSVRAAIADRGLQDVRLHINEYGAAWNFDQPGSHVGYLEALETAGVDVASMACWPVVDLGISYGTCFADPGLLDGLISPLGLETDTYAVHKAYAAMDGTRLQAATTDVWTSAYAVRDAAGTVRSLVGRHESCVVGVDEGCHAGIAAAPAGKPVTLALTMPCRSKYVLTVRLIANTRNTLPSVPTTVAYKTLRCGSAKVALPGLTDGSAYDVVAKPI